MDLSIIGSTSSLGMEELEKHLLKQEQVECPVVHRFGPGVYIREIFMPAGTIVIGHHHRYAHMNVMLKGEMDIVDDDGCVETLKAPFTFIAPPGRKTLHIKEDTVFQNIYAIEETDLDKIEEKLIIKTDLWYDQLACENTKLLESKAKSSEYEDLLKHLDITDDQVDLVGEKTCKLVNLPYGSYKIQASNSLVHGRGIFANAPIESGEEIGPARIEDNVTILGRYLNHSSSPNATLFIRDSQIMLKAISNISGNHGGHLGEEITIDYKVNAFRTEEV